MSDADTSRQATIAELKKACPNASSEFYLEQVEKNATLEQAKDDYIASLQLAAEEQAKQLVEAKKKAAQSAASDTGTTGVADLNDGDSVSSTASAEDFEHLVNAKIKAGTPRRQAIVQVARANPDSHQAFLLARNTGGKQQELIKDRFAQV